MDKKAALTVIAKFQKALEAKGIIVNKLILYGSFAIGQFKEGSDIDIVVIANDFADKTYWERINILSDAIYEVFAPLEVVGITPDEWERGDSFIVDYARNGEVVYAA